MNGIKIHRDEDTGFLMGTANLKEYEFRSKKQLEAYKKMVYKQSGRGTKFTFARMEATKEVVKTLTTAQCGYLLMLQSYIGYQDGIIKNPDKSPMDKGDMMDVLKLRKRKNTFYDFFNRCVENDIILIRGEAYSINERYHFKGENKGDSKVTKIYSKQIRNLNQDVKPVDLGLLYRLLPYIHLQTNTLCTNPYEDDPTKLEKLNRKQLAEIIGYDVSAISKRLLKLTINAKYAIAKVTVGGQESFLVNPWVFYRLKIAPTDNLVSKEVNYDKPDATLLSIFSVKI
jgi:hypothetical protein